jgi:predicted glycoside hydrolase/deacetylase ChbG (UPF0249 family)
VNTLRYLIVNADDFGLSPGVNRGIVRAHEEGIVTSASLMVRWPAASEAASYSATHPGLSLGIHIDLGEWACRDGEWVPIYEVVPPEDKRLVAEEVARQFARFRQLAGSDPTHIDSHQHLHRREPIRSVLIKYARDLGVPLRHYSHGVRYCGEFYGQTAEGEFLPDNISLDRLLEILAQLSPGLTELACHPGEGEDNLDTMYQSERAQEVNTLCSEQLTVAMREMGIQLCSFRDAKGLFAIDSAQNSQIK